ncbi:hypothetical protein DEO72_LG11g2410 [Vigna unguiculata]|uniref:Uncharacterized protein n=1 Tax=Vigna unguiculata TaxID=3917 RepID=A0A4D6NSC7_VIGUN|nr:hypothetical protein DEO72_LG11g2410 [Vigna unguiculata]
MCGEKLEFSQIFMHRLAALTSLTGASAVDYSLRGYYGTDTAPDGGVRPSGDSGQSREVLDVWCLMVGIIPPGDTYRQSGTKGVWRLTVLVISRRSAYWCSLSCGSKRIP